MLLDAPDLRHSAEIAPPATEPRMVGETPVSTRLVLAQWPLAQDIAACFRREVMSLQPLQAGQLLLRTHLVSVDDCAQARLQVGAPAGSRLEPGQVMPCATVSRVLRSRHPAFREGDHVLSHSGWQTHEVVDAHTIKRKLYPTVAPLGSALGVYGLHGYIAWLAVREACRPRPGQTAVVAAAAGPLGATACQLLQECGARVVAVTSGPTKCALVQRSFAPHVVLDREDPDFAAKLAAACPDGVDIFLENVDGRCLDAVLPLMNEGARLPLCRAMESQWHGNDQLPAFLNAILERRLEVRTFTSSSLAGLRTRSQADPDFVSEMGARLRGGQLRWLEEVMEGLDALPLALARLARHENLGKLLVRLDPTDTHSTERKR